VGRAAVAALGSRHEIIKAGRSSGDLRVDISNSASIAAMFEQTGKLDAVVCCAGQAHFSPLAQMTEDDFLRGLKNKLMGQVSVVLKGRNHVNDGGSFTLTSGSLDRYPVRGASNAATINAALGGFVKSAALDLDRGIRINLVSPTLLEESKAKFAGLLPGHEAVPSTRVGLAYVRSVDGAQTGEVFTVG
jgi:NAD(P)-dependent dehydrogenase (short-subunit alcohol dehydrogenase family)